MTTFTAYRVIAGGTHIQPLEHVRSTRNGWHTYRVLPPDPMAGATTDPTTNRTVRTVWFAEETSHA